MLDRAYVKSIALCGTQLSTARIAKLTSLFESFPSGYLNSLSHLAKKHPVHPRKR